MPGYAQYISYAADSGAAVLAAIDGMRYDSAELALSTVGTTVANTWYTVADITGKGYATKLKMYTPGNLNYFEIELTVDGVVKTIQIGANYAGLADGTGTVELIGPIWFDTSFKMRTRLTSGTNAQSGSVHYVLA